MHSAPALVIRHDLQSTVEQVGGVDAEHVPRLIRQPLAGAVLQLEHPWPVALGFLMENLAQQVTRNLAEECVQRCPFGGGSHVGQGTGREPGQIHAVGL